ncbi:MAG: helix-turn-helix transcriptional regulator [Gemmatimonadetes bacterium]|nr:helix-turn-helix transcriptional regulator [Gemmatimonadota bacterium]
MADAARRLRIDLDQLAEWEAGEVHPTVAQLRKAAEVYRRPLAVFFLPTAPKKFEAMRDFRRVAGTETRATLTPADVRDSSCSTEEGGRSRALAGAG